ncbi:hypothetical protein Anas_14149 [Armadillidium nasatum]|uniref:Uncharacterized protein n=1 Tax=Armadillidium nasatum TaxID=96803 RepID=A0A5N5T072_9CRUS|nr:hypothetical protein Anas_14149 [Armadillidium nasatum]
MENFLSLLEVRIDLQNILIKHEIGMKIICFHEMINVSRQESYKAKIYVKLFCVLEIKYVRHGFIKIFQTFIMLICYGDTCRRLQVKLLHFNATNQVSSSNLDEEE